MDFTDIFRTELARANFTHKSFADRVGVTSGFVSLVATGKSKMPMDSAEKWADVLGLSGEVRKWFILHAALAYVPDEAVRKVISDDLVALNERVAQLSEKVAALTERVRGRR